MKILTESEWFDHYYPKSWGNWREYYNAGMYGKHPNATGCCWMDYKLTGYLLNTNLAVGNSQAK